MIIQILPTKNKKTTFWNIGKWHLAGSMTQSLVSVVAGVVFANAAIALLYIPALIHFVGTFIILKKGVPYKYSKIDIGGGMAV